MLDSLWPSRVHLLYTSLIHHQVIHAVLFTDKLCMPSSSGYNRFLTNSCKKLRNKHVIFPFLTMLYKMFSRIYIHILTIPCTHRCTSIHTIHRSNSPSILSSLCLSLTAFPYRAVPACAHGHWNEPINTLATLGLYIGQNIINFQRWCMSCLIWQEMHWSSFNINIKEMYCFSNIKSQIETFPILNRIKLNLVVFLDLHSNN